MLRMVFMSVEVRRSSSVLDNATNATVNTDEKGGNHGMFRRGRVDGLLEWWTSKV